MLHLLDMTNAAYIYSIPYTQAEYIHILPEARGYSASFLYACEASNACSSSAPSGDPSPVQASQPGPAE